MFMSGQSLLVFSLVWGTARKGEHFFSFSLGALKQLDADSCTVISAKWKYQSAMIIFAVLTLYMLAAAIVSLVRSFRSGSSALLAQIVISLAATYGVWVVASILAFDPLHLLTSSVQYILFQACECILCRFYFFQVG